LPEQQTDQSAAPSVKEIEAADPGKAEQKE
jgi:hypothetical protein